MIENEEITNTGDMGEYEVVEVLEGWRFPCIWVYLYN